MADNDVAKDDGFGGVDDDTKLPMNKDTTATDAGKHGCSIDTVNKLNLCQTLLYTVFVAGASAAASKVPAEITKAGILPGLEMVRGPARELRSEPWRPANEITSQV